MSLSLDLIKHILFFPVAWIWENVYKVRRVFFNFGIFKQNIYQVPVISVGNVTFGGTGKTPFTIWLAELFESHSLRPLVLTRGYKGGLEHGSGIIKGGDLFKFNPSSYGDEALLIARKLKSGAVVVGKNRSHNLEMYFDKIHPDVVLLDDGFQHLKIHRNLNILLFDALLPLSRYKVAPYGFLREGLSSLRDADVVVISRSELVPKMKLDSLKELICKHVPPETPLAEISYEPCGLFDGYHRSYMQLAELQGRKVVCVVALGSPHSFFSLVEELGAKIVKRYVFPDHHYYSKVELDEIVNFANENQAIVVTSEKDIVKIRRVSRYIQAYYVGIKLKFNSGEEVVKKLVIDRWRKRVKGHAHEV